MANCHGWAGISPFVPVKQGHPGFYSKAVHVEEATPELYVQGAGPAKSNSLLPFPALIPANAPTIVGAMSLENVFDDDLESQDFIYEQPITAYWKDKPRLDGLERTPAMNDGT
jgi:hypothetical protein